MLFCASRVTPSAMSAVRLIYWPSLPGRGEFVRLILEDVGAEYVDVARRPEAEGGGFPAVLAYYEGQREGHPVMAPPILEDGDLVIAQTHVICAYLAEHHGLVPDEPAGRLHARQVHLTLLDLATEAHDTHHPLGVSLYYEQQKRAAQAHARQFLESRLPRFLAHFEHVLERGAGRWLVADRCTYADLAAFQVLEGLEYAFPRGFAEVAAEAPRLLELRHRVADRPRLAAYLRSSRRLPFNLDGVFRHYPELDLPA